MAMTPLTPADCDLQDFQFMPLDVLRLRDSDLAIHTTGEEFRCAVLLWCAAWHQVPAASLPDDDKSLASLAGYGRAVNEWLKHKEGALRGWIKCDDGRLYHPVVAEKAREAWASKHRHAHQKLSERVRKLNKIREQRGLPAAVVPPFDEWLSAGMPTEKEFIPPESGALSAGKPQTFRRKNSEGSQTPDQEQDVGYAENGTYPQGEMHKKHIRRNSAGKDDRSAGNTATFRRNDAEIPPENALNGQGQGQGEKRKEESLSPRPAEEPPPRESDFPGGNEDYLPSPTAYGLMAKLLRTHGIDVAPGRPDFREWVDKGLTDEEALAAIQSARLSKPAPEPIPWPYLAKVLTTQRQAAQAVPDKPAQPAKAAPQVDRWWINEAGIDRKARELGMFARGGETYPAFKDRIFAELRKRGEATPQEQAA